MVRRTPSNLVLVVCAETSTALCVLFICVYLSFEFQFAFRIAFRLLQAGQSSRPRPLSAHKSSLRPRQSTPSACRTDLEQNLLPSCPRWTWRGERQARHYHVATTQSVSLSIHSRIYGVQFSSFTPFASHLIKKRITSRSTTPTSLRSKTMSW